MIIRQHYCRQKSPQFISAWVKFDSKLYKYYAYKNLILIIISYWTFRKFLFVTHRFVIDISRKNIRLFKLNLVVAWFPFKLAIMPWTKIILYHIITLLGFEKLRKLIGNIPLFHCTLLLYLLYSTTLLVSRRDWKVSLFFGFYFIASRYPQFKSKSERYY